MRIAVCLASGDALSQRAARRASRFLLLAACAVCALFAVIAVLILHETRTIAGRNAFLAERTAKMEAEVRGGAGDAEWKSLRDRGAFLSSGLRAGGPGVVETLGAMESALPAGVALRQIQLSRAGALAVEGASKTLGGGEQFRKRLDAAESRWELSLENTGFDQSRGEYGFRMKGGWKTR